MSQAGKFAIDRASLTLESTRATPGAVVRHTSLLLWGLSLDAAADGRMELFGYDTCHAGWTCRFGTWCMVTSQLPQAFCASCQMTYGIERQFKAIDRSPGSGIHVSPESMKALSKLLLQGIIDHAVTLDQLDAGERLRHNLHGEVRLSVVGSRGVPRVSLVLGRVVLDFQCKRVETFCELPAGITRALKSRHAFVP